MSLRSDFRALARQALATDARLGTLTQISTWAGNISASRFPVIGVVTPQEKVQPETLEHFHRSTVLQVVVKRLGADDLEDLLDEDADAIEACICPAFFAAGWQCLPEGLTIVLNGDGEQRIGTVMAAFTITWRRTLDGRTF